MVGMAIDLVTLKSKPSRFPARIGKPTPIRLETHRRTPFLYGNSAEADRDDRDIAQNYVNLWQSHSSPELSVRLGGKSSKTFSKFLKVSDSVDISAPDIGRVRHAAGWGRAYLG
jgi:hypothetical protein